MECLELDGLIERLKGNVDAVGLREDEVTELCLRVREVFMIEGSVADAPVPVKIVGDIHGQLDDLKKILNTHNWPPSTQYVFLGDYVDRGPYSSEVITLLLALKLKFRDKMFLLRGNHETLAISKVYGFMDECKRRFNVRLWKRFGDVFNTMPLAGVVGGRIFCVHGGISQDLTSWEQLRRIARPTDIPDCGILCDLLWADPRKGTKGFEPSQRGVSFIFGADAVEAFCKDLEIDLIVRAHQVMADGYEFFAKQKLVTIFSASNYCGEFDNAGAVLTVDADFKCSINAHFHTDVRREYPKKK